MSSPITIEQLPQGLYLIEKDSGGFIKHRLILDTGNVSGLFPEPKFKENGKPLPCFIHMHKKDGLSRVSYRQYCEKEAAEFTILGQLSDVQKAVQNIHDFYNKYAVQTTNEHEEMITEVRYNPFKTNCEHFTSFVITGEQESEQLQNAVGWGLGLGYAGICLLGMYSSIRDGRDA